METKNRPAARILQAMASLLLACLWFLAALFLAAAVEIAAEAAGAGENLRIAAGELLGWLPISLLTILYLDRKHGKPERRPLPAPAFAKACIGFALLGIVPLELAVRSLGGPYDLSGETVLGVIIGISTAPVAEELAFRACIFRISRRGLGFKAALLLNLVLFAYIHGNFIGYLVNALPLVAASAAAYERTGDIRIGIAFHVITNLMVDVMAYAVVPAYVAVPLWLVCTVLFLRRAFKAVKAPDPALFPSGAPHA